MFRVVFFLAFFLASCVHQQKSAPSTSSKIVDESEELTVIPPYVGPSGGEAVGIEKGDPAPFDGILLNEEKAKGAADLRINYDQLYQLATADRKYLLAVVEIQNCELESADAQIDDLNTKLDELRNSWWERHKLDVGIGLGIVVGIGLSVATGYVWAEVDNAE